MKKKKAFGISLLAGTVLCCLCAVLFLRMKEDKKTEEKDAVRIGVSVYRWDDTFISSLRAELETIAKNYEKDTGIKVTMDISDAKENQNVQDNQVERFISLGCDVLCINPVDRSSATNIIGQAMDANVPVVFFNREPVEEDMNRWDKLYYIGADAKESAVLQGKIVADFYRNNKELLDENGDGVVKYVLLEGESSHQDSLIRTEWSVQTIREEGVPIEKLTGGIANWDRNQASALMEQWLKEYPDEIELVICNNDDMALGAMDAIDREEIMKKIYVVGIDGTPVGMEALESGKLLGTVNQDIHTYADAIFQSAVALAFGEKVEDRIDIQDGRYYRCPQKALTSFQQSSKP